MATSWNTLFEASPSPGDNPAYGDDAIRESKSAIRERLVKEHNFDLTEAGLQPRQGLHKQGSAVVFHQADAPTQRNGTNLAATDAGLLWFDTDTSVMYVWSGTAWVPQAENITEVTDADLAVTSGTFTLVTPFVHSPVANECTLSVFKRGTTIRQIAYDLETDGTYERIFIDSAWTTWAKNYRAGDYPDNAIISTTGTKTSVGWESVYTCSATPFVKVFLAVKVNNQVFGWELLVMKANGDLTITVQATTPNTPLYILHQFYIRVLSGNIELNAPQNGTVDYVIVPYA
jgi:hypothetical protein